MKYILILSTIIFLLSCNSDTVTISKQEYQKLKGDSSMPTYPKYFELYYEGLTGNNTDGIIPASDGHEYLVTDYGTYSKNVEHYINCVKCKKDTIK